MSDKWIVTGAAGFVGRNCMTALAALDASPVGLDYVIPPEMASSAEVEFHAVDLTDKASLAEVAASQPERVNLLHLAATGTHQSREAQTLDRAGVDSLGLAHQLNSEFELHSSIVHAFASRLQRVVVASSIDVYGEAMISGTPPLTEADVCLPNSRYGLGKIASEGLWRQWGNCSNVPTSIIRLGHLFGPYEELRYVRAIPTFLRKALAGEDIVLHPPATARRTYLFAPDVAKIAVGLAKSGASGTFNVTGEEYVSVRQLASRCLAVVGGSSSRIVESDETNSYNTDPYRTAISNHKLRLAIPGL